MFIDRRDFFAKKPVFCRFLLFIKPMMFIYNAVTTDFLPVV